VGVGDPVAGGLVASISHPQGNTTGVTNLFPSIAGKWLELLKEVMPRLARVALIFNPDFSSGTYFAAIEAAAAQYAVTATRAPVRDAAEIERAIETFAAEPNGGLMILPPMRDDGDYELVNRLAVRHRLPTIHASRVPVTAGGLMSYGPNGADLERRGAFYVDRILRGAKPGDLPVEFPTKFQLAINLKTAKAIGLDIPPTLLALADEVIE
jgi:putative ABC transport system substrate-binding protein